MKWWLFVLTVLLIVFFIINLLTDKAVVSKSESKQPTSTLQKDIKTLNPDEGTPSITYEQMLTVYREILESTARAVDDIHRTADRVLTIVGVIFAVLGISGIGGAWWFSRAFEKAENALKLVKTIESKTQDLEKIQQNISQTLSAEQSQINDLGNELLSWKKSVERDRVALKRSMTLIQIDEHGMALYSKDLDKKWKSLKALLEMSKRPDAIVRRHCVLIFRSMGEVDETVIERLKEMANSDPAQGVKQEAYEALRLLQK